MILIERQNLLFLAIERFKFKRAFAAALTTIPGKIFEADQFSCEMIQYGKSSTPIFKDFFASIDKTFILKERLGTRL